MSDKDSLPSLEELGRSLEKAKARSGEGQQRNKIDSGRQYSFGMRIGIELVAGVLVGVVIGYNLDRWLETRPIFSIVFMLIGMAAGFLNMYRAVMNEDETEK